MFFVLKVLFLRLEIIFSSIVDVLGMFSLLGISIFHLKWDLMSHKCLVLMRFWLFNAAELRAMKGIRWLHCQEDFTVMLGTIYLTDPCVFFICILLIMHRDHKIYNSWNRAVSTTTASWHLTCHFSNDFGFSSTYIYSKINYSSKKISK